MSKEKKIQINASSKDIRVIKEVLERELYSASFQRAKKYEKDLNKALQILKTA